MRTVPLSLTGVSIFQGKGLFHTIYWSSFELAQAPCSRNWLLPLWQPWLTVSLSVALSSGAGVQVCWEHAWERGAGP